MKQKKTNYMLTIVKSLLKKNKIAFDNSELEFQIKSHPSFPSLHAITGVFDHFNIPNIAAKIPNTKDIVNDIPNSFIAQLSIDKKPDLFLVEKKDGAFSYVDNTKKATSLSIDNFLKVFTGIILAVEKDENTQKDSIHSKTNTNIFLFVALLSLVSVFVFSVWSLAPVVMFLVTMIAIFISIAILQQEFGIKNTIGEAFCTSDSDKRNCHAVLFSKGARILGNKLSDLSIMYFAGYALAVFLLSIQGHSLQLLYTMSILAFPITLYSLYYQGFVLKTWCPLCLSIVAILWMQVAIPFTVADLSFTISFEPIELLLIVLSFAMSLTSWKYFKPKYEASIENKLSKISYHKFKKDYTVFSSLLEHKSAMDTKIEGVPEIVFGNPTSNLEILIVTNPFCGHCRPVHQLVEDILLKYNDQVKVIIRFNISLKDTNSDIFRITSNLLHICHNEDIETRKTALHDAYVGLLYNDWMDKWGNEHLDIEKYQAILQQQKDWCSKNGLNFTPAILINGYLFPRLYDRKDLFFFIEDLDETYNTID